MQYLLIGRHHINGKKENSWKYLSKFLRKIIMPIEPTKSYVHNADKINTKNKIKIYNEKFNTDFYIE